MNEYSQTRLIRTLLIRHFHLIRRENLKTITIDTNIKSTF